MTARPRGAILALPQLKESAMPAMRAMVIAQPGSRFRVEERAVPEPARHEVRIRVHACGVCHSDSMVVQGHMPGLVYPRVPGHEVIGTIEAIGADIDGWQVGTRVGAQGRIAVQRHPAQ